MGELYGRITDTIIHQIETAGSDTWICPWHRGRSGLPHNALTGRPYRGINTLSLWCGGQSADYADDRWATYRQWSELGAQVRKGEQGSLVLFFKELPTSSQEEGPDRRFVARASSVFNAEQVLDAPPLAEVQRKPIDPTPIIDRFVETTGATIREGEAACYIPAIDEIRMPARDRFKSAEGYSSTLAHELVHWTGAKPRLDRDLSARFGSRAYAAEELVAELGSAFIVAQLGLAPQPHPQHAAYMAGWLPLLRADARALFTAASLASRAAQYLEATTSPSVPGDRPPLPPSPVRSRIAQRPRAQTWTRGSRLHSHGW